MLHISESVENVKAWKLLESVSTLISPEPTTEHQFRLSVDLDKEGKIAGCTQGIDRLDDLELVELLEVALLCASGEHRID